MRRVVAILILIVAISCEERIEWSIDDSITPRLVVEGVITNSPEQNYVKLSLPVADPHQEPQPVSGAVVIIVSSAGNHLLSQSPSQPGYYIPDTDITGVVGEGYMLYINIFGTEFTSDVVSMRPVSPLKEFRFFETVVMPGFYVINPSEENDPSYTEYLIEHESLESPGDTIRNRFYTFTLRSIDVNQFFKPESERLIFPKEARTVRVKYSMAPDHERYIRALLSETTWSGGWFDVLPGNLHTNMSQGAVGYFGACTVVKDTVYFE